jgi:hypothetical protein
MYTNKKDIFEFFSMDENLGTILSYENFHISSQGSLPKEALTYLENIEEPGIVVEIGVHAGWTLLQAFSVIKNKDVRIYGIDCWEDISQIDINGIKKEEWTEESFNKFLHIHKSNREHLQHIISEIDKERICKIIQGFSFDKNVLNSFKDQSISFLHVDGDHSYEGCLQDLRLWFSKIKPNGVIVGDDYNWEKVKKAADQFIQETPNIEVTLLNNKYIIKKI